MQQPKTVKVVKMHIFLDCVYKSQDFAQCQNIFMQAHNCENVTFRNSAQTLKILADPESPIK